MPRVQFGRGSGPDWNLQTVLRQSHQRSSTECVRGGPDLRSVCPVGWTRARIIELERRAKSDFALRVRRSGNLPNSAPKLFESWTPFAHERISLCQCVHIAVSGQPLLNRRSHLSEVWSRSGCLFLPSSPKIKRKTTLIEAKEYLRGFVRKFNMSKILSRSKAVDCYTRNSIRKQGANHWEQATFFEDVRI